MYVCLVMYVIVMLHTMLCRVQGKVVHQCLSISSSFSQRVRVQQVGSLTEDPRFYHKRLKNSRDEIEPKRRSKVQSAAHTRRWYVWNF